MRILPTCNHTWVEEFHNPLDTRTEIICMYCLTTLAWLIDDAAEDIDEWRARMRSHGIIQ